MSFDTLLSDPSLKEIHSEGISAIINRLGQTCLLQFPKEISPCPNCYYDTINKRSTSIPKPSPIIPFLSGTICPYCKGNGKLDVPPVTRSIQLAVIWNTKDWLALSSLVTLDWHTPNSMCQCFGHWSEVNYLKRASSIVVSDDLSGTVRLEMELFGEPLPQGLETKFFVQMLKRIGS